MTAPGRAVDAGQGGPPARGEAVGPPLPTRGRSHRTCADRATSARTPGAVPGGARGAGYERLVAAFAPNWRVGLIASRATAHRAGGLRPGMRAPRGLRRVTTGVVARRAGRASSYVYGIRRGRVRWVGVASSSVVRRPSALRALVRSARLT